jgi:hypothetical protein
MPWFGNSDDWHQCRTEAWIASVRELGIDAPLYVCLSSRVGLGMINPVIRQAQAPIWKAHASVFAGHEIESLEDAIRSHGFHFNVRSLEAFGALQSLAPPGAHGHDLLWPVSLAAAVPHHLEHHPQRPLSHQPGGDRGLCSDLVFLDRDARVAVQAVLHAHNPLKPFGRIQSLEVLRGIAALAVAWFHITHGGKLLADAASPLLQAASALGAIGFQGITLFFVLSGFVIPWSIRNAPPVDGLLGSLRDLPSFLLRRLLRLQPPYAVALVLALGLNVLSTLAPGYQGSFSVTLPQALYALLSDNLYLTGLLGSSWILVVAWTLALEVQFYVVAGLIEPWARPTQREVFSPWIYGLGVAAVSALAVLIPQNTLVFRVLPVFALGWITAHQAMRPRAVHWLATAWLLLLMARVAGIEQAVVAAVCVALLHLGACRA